MSVTINAYRDVLTGGYQLSIDDDSGGYRLAGPKFCGESFLLVSRTLTERDITEIESYLATAKKALAAKATHNPHTRGEGDDMPMPSSLNAVSYFVNIWEFRATGGLAPEVFDQLDDALAEIADGSDKFRYIETITRHRDNSATVADLRQQALDWDHDRREAERAESERMMCVTRQRRRAG